MRTTVISSGRTTIPQAPALSAGQGIGPCKVIRPIGSGGFATAYLAKRVNMDKPVVLKACPSSETTRATVLWAEGRYMHFLNAEDNPHVPLCFDYGASSGWTYVVMEKISGQSFRSMIRIHNQQRSRFPLVEFFRLSFLVCDGLQAMSRVGTEFGVPAIHRDLKPEHVIYDWTRNIVRFVDFGLGAVGFGEIDELNHDGLFRGTAEYSAPEMWRARPDIDERADIYSYGITAFELLTGRRPFQARSVPGYRSRHFMASLPHCGRPQPVQELLEWMTAKAREERPDNWLTAHRGLEWAARQVLTPAADFPRPF